MITHTRGQARTCVYAQGVKRFITRNFSSLLNRILKTESVQSRNRFRKIRYSKMDIPSTEAKQLENVRTEIVLKNIVMHQKHAV